MGLQIHLQVTSNRKISWLSLTFSFCDPNPLVLGRPPSDKCPPPTAGCSSSPLLKCHCPHPALPASACATGPTTPEPTSPRQAAHDVA